EGFRYGGFHFIRVHGSRLFNISVILIQVRVSDHIRCRQRENGTVRLNGNPFLCTAFKWPYVSITGILSETDQISAAVCLPIKFTEAFIQYKIERNAAHISVGVTECTLTQLIHIRYGGSHIATLSTAEHRFGINQVGICQSEQREVHGTLRAIVRGGGGTVTVHVLEFHHRYPLVKQADILYGRVFTVKHRTAVRSPGQVIELIHEGSFCPVAPPATVRDAQ